MQHINGRGVDPLTGNYSFPGTVGVTGVTTLTGQLVTQAGVVRAFSTKSNSYAMLAGDDVIIVSGSSKTITLPDATTNAGRICTIKNGNVTGTVVASAAGKVDGATNDSTILATAWLNASYVSNGTDWFSI